MNGEKGSHVGIDARLPTACGVSQRRLLYGGARTGSNAGVFDTPQGVCDIRETIPRAGHNDIYGRSDFQDAMHAALAAFGG